MSETSGRSGDRANDTEPDTERVRRVRLMQVRLSARRRVAAMQNVTAQTMERTTRYMQAGVYRVSGVHVDCRSCRGLRRLFHQAVTIH